MNKLLAMQTFVRVVEGGSFTAAADAMDVSVSAVAKVIGRLEADLRTQLLIRTTRRMSVTDRGRDYYASCRRVLGEIDDMEQALAESQASPTGRVTLLCPMFFGRVNLMPRLSEFYARYPDLELEIRFSGRFDEVINSGVNLAVVVGNLEDSRFAARQLSSGPIVCAATPAYLDRHGRPEEIDDLLQHNCLVSRSSLWRFSEGDRIIELPIRGNLTVHEGDALREATLLGLGITQSNYWLFRQDLANGTLEEVLPQYRVPGRPISVLYAPTRFLPRKLRVTIDFLVEITAGEVPAVAPRTASLDA